MEARSSLRTAHIARPDERTRELPEQRRVRWCLPPHLLDVAAVVHPQADDLRGVRDDVEVTTEDQVDTLGRERAIRIVDLGCRQPLVVIEAEMADDKRAPSGRSDGSAERAAAILAPSPPRERRRGWG